MYKCIHTYVYIYIYMYTRIMHIHITVMRTVKRRVCMRCRSRIHRYMRCVVCRDATY